MNYNPRYVWFLIRSVTSMISRTSMVTTGTKQSLKLASTNFHSASPFPRTSPQLLKKMGHTSFCKCKEVKQKPPERPLRWHFIPLFLLSFWWEMNIELCQISEIWQPWHTIFRNPDFQTWKMGMPDLVIEKV